jgi:hypothetical protein
MAFGEYPVKKRKSQTTDHCVGPWALSQNRATGIAALRLFRSRLGQPSKSWGWEGLRPRLLQARQLPVLPGTQTFNFDYLRYAEELRYLRVTSASGTPLETETHPNSRREVTQSSNG